MALLPYFFSAEGGRLSHLLLGLLLGVTCLTHLARAGRAEGNIMPEAVSAKGLTAEANSRHDLRAIELRAATMLRQEPIKKVDLLGSLDASLMQKGAEVTKPTAASSTPTTPTSGKREPLRLHEAYEHHEDTLDEDDPRRKYLAAAKNVLDEEARRTPQYKQSMADYKEITDKAKQLKEMAGKGAFDIQPTIDKAGIALHLSTQLHEQMANYAQDLINLQKGGQGFVDNIFKYHKKVHSDIDSAINDATLPKAEKAREEYVTQKGQASRLNPLGLHDNRNYRSPLEEGTDEEVRTGELDTDEHTDEEIHTDSGGNVHGRGALTHEGDVEPRQLPPVSPLDGPTRS